jgi:hypothetical protein
MPNFRPISMVGSSMFKTVSNEAAYFMSTSLGRAEYKYWLGKRLVVRGVVMKQIDRYESQEWMVGRQTPCLRGSLAGEEGIAIGSKCDSKIHLWFQCKNCFAAQTAAQNGTWTIVNQNMQQAEVMIKGQKEKYAKRI